jgi:ABC-type amino acid transport substrate-binding protein
VTVVALAVAALLAVTAGAEAEARRLRVCADPSNLPFSAQHATEPGFEIELARAIARTIGAELGVVWVPTAREVVALRPLHEGRCDFFMGLPVTPAFRDDKPELAFSAPYYVMRQVLVSPTIGGVAALDELRGKLVGVQAMTLGDQLVYERGVTRKVYRNADEVFAALLTSEVDASVIDSPLGGWFVKTTPGFRAIELTDARRDVPIGVAVRKTDTALRDQIDAALGELQPTALGEVLARYGLRPAPAPRLAQAPSPEQPSPAQAAPALSAELREARSTYLTQCSQCHGTDGKGSPLAANLQAFKGSEDDFLRVVRNGRAGTAMVPWKGLISDEDIRGIARYIRLLAGDPARP